MKIIQLVWGIAFLMLFSCNPTEVKTYPEADAVYINFAKTFTLNKDGSIVSTVEKKQKLLTYRSFQSLYGETRINYNPAFQKLAINEAFAVNSQNQTIKTPENGFNDILPSFCVDSKEYSHIREMVITHTGLERNTVINCSYSITSEAGKIPFLMGIEELQSDCPIENLTITIKVPSGKVLNYVLMNVKTEPVLERGKDFDTYTWKLKDIPQRNKEIRSAMICEDVPTLLFSTQQDRKAPMKWALETDASSNSVSEAVKKYIDLAIKDKKTNAEKVLKIQELVVNELKTINLLPILVAFRTRTPDQVWQSNLGTTYEKTRLLTTLLRTEGFNAEAALIIPECCADEKMPFLLASEPVVKYSGENGEIMMLSAERLNTGNFDFHATPGKIVSFGSDSKELNTFKQEGSISIEGQLTIDPNGKIKGDLTGQFSNSFNPYFELIRNQGKCPPMVMGFAGSVGKLTPGHTDIVFKSENKDSLTVRGDFRFILLKEVKTGIGSLHLLALPFKRTTQLNLGSAINESYRFTYKIPEGIELSNPISLNLSKPGIGNVSIILIQSGTNVEVTRKINILKPEISAVEYLSFKELIDKWNTQKFKQLIFKKG